MKFVKALNQGIVTDLGLGQHIYSITLEGCEVEDQVAAKLKEVFGHLIEVTEASAVIDATPLPETPVTPEVTNTAAPSDPIVPVTTEGAQPSEGTATQGQVVPEVDPDQQTLQAPVDPQA